MDNNKKYRLYLKNILNLTKNINNNLLQKGFLFRQAYSGR